MLVSIAILAILMAIIAQLAQLTSQTYRQNAQATGTMREARAGFERMTRNLSQATLNTYYSYFYNAAQVPQYYMRQSELQFVSGNGPVGGGSFIDATVGNATQITHAVFFQAPLGRIDSSSPADEASYSNLDHLLNACGYFVAYAQDSLRPSFLGTTTLPNTYHFRLMEFLQPSEYLSIYSTTDAPPADGSMPKWISDGFPNITATATNPVTVRSLANNIVALIVMPEEFLKGTTTDGENNTQPVATQSGTFNYDSAYQAAQRNGPVDSLGAATQGQTANQLPPLVKVIMVAIDEPSATRLINLNGGATSTTPPNLGQSQLFQDPSKLLTSGGTEGDLEKFEDVLNATPGNITGNKIKLSYSVFQSDVVIRGAKWTSQ